MDLIHARDGHSDNRGDIPHTNPSVSALIASLRSFIELSQLSENTPWQVWVSSSVRSVEGSCWEKRNCTKESCPAYKNECGRCWLITGTLCDNCSDGGFADKYATCLHCEIFRGIALRDPLIELRELLLILTYSFRSKHLALQNALENVRTLRGLLPICAACKKIRDDTGYWNHLEEYITAHSEAWFSHGLCPVCAEHAIKEIDLYRSDANPDA